MRYWNAFSLVKALEAEQSTQQASYAFCATYTASRAEGAPGKPGLTHALRGAVKGVVRFQDAFARLWISDEPRRVSAWREVDASYGVRSCQQRESMRIPVQATARTVAWCALPWSRCCWSSRCATSCIKTRIVGLRGLRGVSWSRCVRRSATWSAVLGGSSVAPLGINAARYRARVSGWTGKSPRQS
jgi:hypothetical protein